MCIYSLYVCMHSLHHCTMCMYIYTSMCIYDHSSYLHIRIRAYDQSLHCMFPDSFLLSNVYSIVLFVKSLLISLHNRYVAALCANLSPFYPVSTQSHRPIAESRLAWISCLPSSYLLISRNPVFSLSARHSPYVRAIFTRARNRTYIRPRTGGSNWSIAIR